MGKADRGHERFIREVVASTVGECRRCHCSYDIDSVSILGHQDELWFFSLVCGQCQSQGLVAAQIVTDPGVPAAPGSETAGVADPPDLSNPPTPVDAADVREIREFLDEFDGDFQAFFQRRGK